jgi:hypothetical protein
MGKIITNRQLIAAPPTAPLRYGIFTAANVVPMDRRIIASGLQFLVDHCDTAAEYDQTCEVSPTKPFIEGSDLMAADPYWIVARKRCGTVGRSAEEMLRAARQVLLTSAQTRVEAVFWNGGALASATPTLDTSGATVVTPPAPGFGAAISALERAFYAVNGYIGTIHVSTRAEGAAAYSQMIQKGSAGQLTTPIGSVWDFGAGFPLTGLADAAPAAGFAWAFMTGPVTIWRSGILPQPDPRQTLDRTLNQWDTVAEEVFAHTWDCDNVFAVQVPLAAPATAATPAVP